MKTVEIPREAWVDWLNQFTVTHENQPVSVDILGPDIGAQPQIDNLPLIGVSADRLDHDGTIAVSVAGSAAQHLTHIIPAVTGIYVEETDEGAHLALNIVSGDGTKTILRLQVAAQA
jgi:hypothetical protein